MQRWKRPDSYIGAEWPEYFVFLGQRRDSDAVTRSNFRTGLRALAALPPAPDCEDGSRIVVRENHWAVGWVEWIAVHETDTAAIAACDAMLARLDNYPVLDEEDLSDLEYGEACDRWERARVRDRLDMIRESGAAVSAFASRRSELPSDPDGRLWEYLTTD